MNSGMPLLDSAVDAACARWLSSISLSGKAAASAARLPRRRDKELLILADGLDGIDGECISTTAPAGGAAAVEGAACEHVNDVQVELLAMT